MSPGQSPSAIRRKPVFAPVLKGHVAIADAIFRKAPRVAIGCSGAGTPWRAGLDPTTGPVTAWEPIFPFTKARSGYQTRQWRGPGAGHGDLQRTRLLQTRRLRHSYRESRRRRESRDAGRRDRPLLRFEHSPRPGPAIDRHALLDDGELTWVNAYLNVFKTLSQRVWPKRAHGWKPLPGRSKGTPPPLVGNILQPSPSIHPEVFAGAVRNARFENSKRE